MARPKKVKTADGSSNQLKLKSKVSIKTVTNQTMQNSVTVSGDDLLAVFENNGLIFNKNGKVTISENKPRTRSFYGGTKSMSIGKNKNYKISCVKKTTTETEVDQPANDNKQEENNEPVPFILD